VNVSSAVAAIPRSGIREIMDLAWATPDTIIAATGEPNFPTPPHVVRAAMDAANAGKTKYTPNAGIPELRDALVEKIRMRNGYTVTREQVVVTAGGVEALYTSMAAILDPDDEILLPDPGWPNFAMGAAMIRATPVLYPLHEDRGFVAQIADLETRITAKTKALLINSPSNPIGSVVDREHMTALVAFAKRHDLWLISDECYDETTFDASFVSAAAIGGTEQIISCYTFSKTYAMTGWRIGYAVLPLAVAAQVAKLQEPVTSCVNHPAQYAALAALTGPQDAVVAMRDEYKRRRDFCLATLREAGLDVSTPSGAFYLWVKLGDVGCTSVEFARSLVTDDKFAVAPGTAFGPSGEGYVRISLATAPELLEEGLQRMIGAIARRRTLLV